MPVGVLLALAIAVEVAATISLRASDGFTKLLPSVLVVIGYATSFYLLSLILRDLSVGTTYAIWAGAGTAAIAVIGITSERKLKRSSRNAAPSTNAKTNGTRSASRSLKSSEPAVSPPTAASTPGRRCSSCRRRPSGLSRP